MKFNYKSFNGIFRPVISIRLKHKDLSLKYEVLVDSGADISIFHAEVADYLGIDYTKGKKNEVFGVGGKSSIYYLCPIIIEVGGWAYNIQAGFMPNVAGNVMHYGLVGQIGFFDNFIVKFDLLKKGIEANRRTFLKR